MKAITSCRPASRRFASSTSRGRCRSICGEKPKSEAAILVAKEGEAVQLYQICRLPPMRPPAGSPFPSTAQAAPQVRRIGMQGGEGGPAPFGVLDEAAGAADADALFHLAGQLRCGTSHYPHSR